METLYFWGGIGLLIALSAFWAHYSKIRADAKQFHVQAARLQGVEAGESQLRRDREAFARSQQIWTEQQLKDVENVERIAAEKAVGFPWLADAYAEYSELKVLRAARELATKRHPAPVAAEQVRAYGRRARQAEREARVHRYLVSFYEGLFPWLAELRDPEIDDLLLTIKDETNAPPDEETQDDPARRWLSSGEYAQLSRTERFDLALRRYKESRKSKWEIGRDFERYVGYRMEQDGYSVSYHGIIEGFADLGRDLIATRGKDVRVVQCKYWSQSKEIHENHVFQLYGSVIAFRADRPESNVTGVLATSTRLSSRAHQFAKMLSIDVIETMPLEEYPLVKCNVAMRDGARIYHLPFDQQYDRTFVAADRGEFYAWSAAEAESHGFRRAFRWHGD